MKNWRVLFLLALVILAVGAGVAVRSIASLRWRTDLLFLKAAGEIPDLEWRDVPELIESGSGVWLESIRDVRNPYWAIRSPTLSPAEVDAGRRHFQQACASCHGPDGAGGSGGALNTGHFKTGSSDWSLFRTVRQGVTGTAMGPSGLDAAAAWQVVAYVRALVLDASPYKRTEDNAPRQAVADVMNVSAGDLAQVRPNGPWLTHAGSYDGRRHSELGDISPTTVDRLRLDWVFQAPSPGDPIVTRPVVPRAPTGSVPLGVTPLVVGDVMFVNHPRSDVFALDARTGEVLWSKSGPDVPPDTISAAGIVNAGMAIHGHTLLVSTIDAHLLAIDARDGRTLWDQTVANYRDGYTMVGAPLVVGDKVIVGVGGSDRGIRGFLDAYHVANGTRAWRFNTIPGPGERGHDTWTGDAWQKGGGSTPVIGTYDPSLGLIYWGVGNASPIFEGDVRPGANLFTASVIALEPETGKLRWFFQVMPHDERDWGVTQIPVLADVAVNGVTEKRLYIASRNGFLYALNRVDGKFIAAWPFVRQSWNAGFQPNGTPIEVPHTRPTVGGTFVYPGHAGGTNWWSPSLDLERGLFLLVARDGYSSIFYKSKRLEWADGARWGGRATASVGTTIRTSIRALDLVTGQMRWAYDFPGAATYKSGGILTTASGVTFAGEKGLLVALDSTTGREIWRYTVGGSVDATPIHFVAGGKERLVIAAGRSLLSFSLEPR